jgi:NRPS condensation-like uncharacterized protein
MIENNDTQLSNALANLRAMQDKATALAKEYQKAVLYNQMVYQFANLCNKDALHASLDDAVRHHPILRSNRAAFSRGLVWHMLDSIDTLEPEDRFTYVAANGDLNEQGIVFFSIRF